jgi:tRNA (guanine-N7-)-methyltransferase
MSDRNALWRTIFGNDHPVEIEIGPGTGTFVLSVAPAHPERNYFAVEHSNSRAVQLEAAVAGRGLRNVRILRADAGCVVSRLIPAASVAAYHIYFPDPWWKRRHHRRRLVTPAFVTLLARTLVGGGRVYIATDVDEVFARMHAALSASGHFTLDAALRSPRTLHTRFEHKGLTRGATIHDATFVRSGWDAAS